MQLNEATLRLRRDILSGCHAADGKLGEVPLAATLGVSRTLVRLALAELEREGLVRRAPGRGYRVRSFTLDEVADAIDVRGELEGMAARLCAERGLGASDCAVLAALLEEMDGAIEMDVREIGAQTRWGALNGRFHAGLVRACGNTVIADTIAQVSRIPLVAATAIVFETIDRKAMTARLRRSHVEHRDVFEAVVARQGGRAEAIMREHARRSAANKRFGFQPAMVEAQAETLPGLSLVRVA